MLTAPYADVRPAWASTWRCKSSWELVMVTKGNRKLGTVRDLVEEAGVRQAKSGRREDEVDIEVFVAAQWVQTPPGPKDRSHLYNIS